MVEAWEKKKTDEVREMPCWVVVAVVVVVA